MENKIANLAVVSNKTFEAAQTASLHHYDISSALQTTLDFYELIIIFSSKIKKMIPHSGVEYHNSAFDLEFQSGISTRHSCSYTLTIEDQELGELKLTRQQRFNDEDLKLLETLLCCLIYPLKNATIYKQALLMAYTDPLTKAKNRAAFNDSLQREYQLARRNSAHLSLVFIDIDHFKSINDNYGHECGDVALASVAGIITENIRGSDIIFRYGGEEFVCLLSNTDLNTAGEVAERIRLAIADHTLAYGMKTLNMTASLGVSTLNGVDSMDSFVNRADKAMYQAKKQGRNQVKIAKK
jgi:diguanylate cyclase (GGDEF)-like protein